MITQTICRNLALVAAALSMLAFYPAAEAADVEVIDNAPFAIDDEQGIQASIISIRPFTTVGAGLSGKIDDIRFSRNLLLDSALQFEEVRRAIENEGFVAEDLSLQQLHAIIQGSDYPEEYLYQSDRTSRADWRVVESNLPTERVFKLWDATTLTNFVATGVIDVYNTSFVNVDGSEIELAGLNPALSQEIGIVYERLPQINNQPVVETANYLAEVRSEVRQYGPLERSILQNMGEITFGHPTIYTFAEKDLVLPNSVVEKYDVYWFDLAATFREMDTNELAEMVLNFALPPGSIALELVPLQYSQEFVVARDIGTPELGVEFQGARISVGEFFRKTVSYTYLKPTIVAYGLGERKFSWSIRDEAIRAGSHRFVAVVGVPKDSTDLEIAMSGHVRLKKGTFGGLFAGGEIAGSDVVVVPVSF